MRCWALHKWSLIRLPTTCIRFFHSSGAGDTLRMRNVIGRRSCVRVSCQPLKSVWGAVWVFLFFVLIAIILGIWQIYGQHSLDHCVSAIASAPSWEMEMVRHVRIAYKMRRAAVNTENKWDWKRIKYETVMNNFDFSCRNCANFPSLHPLFHISSSLISNGQLRLTERLIRQAAAAYGHSLSETSWDCLTFADKFLMSSPKGT